jgi:hypothetical protein
VLADSDSAYSSSINAGASGYLINKDITCTKLTQTIKSIYAKKYLPEGTTEELVRLIVPPPFDIGQFLRFTNQIETILHRDTNTGCIVRISGNFRKGAAVTSSLGQISTCEFFNELHHMPSIKEVNESTMPAVIALNKAQESFLQNALPCWDQVTTVQTTLSRLAAS